MLNLSTLLIIAGTAVLLWAWRHSLPMSWTIRLFYIQLKGRYCAAAPAGGTKEKVTQSEPHLLLSHLPRPGSDIFEQVFTSSSFTATVDECDFNFHLSNSSYPRAFDHARVECGTRLFLRGYLDGSWIALGGTSFRFLQEIPLGAIYWIRIRILTWDDKWMYIQGEFITKPKKSKLIAPESDGDKYLVNCVALAKTCIKSGRKTIPPWLFFAANGYAPSSSTKATANWTKAEDLRVKLLSEARLKAKGKGNSDLAKDSFLAGRGYSKVAGLFTRYIPSTSAVSKSDSAVNDSLNTFSQELEPWMDRKHWDVEGWETKRIQGFEMVRQLSLAAL